MAGEQKIGWTIPLKSSYLRNKAANFMFHYSLHIIFSSIFNIHTVAQCMKTFGTSHSFAFKSTKAFGIYELSTTSKDKERVKNRIQIRDCHNNSEN